MLIELFLRAYAEASCVEDALCDGERVDGIFRPCTRCMEISYYALFPLGTTLDWASKVC